MTPDHRRALIALGALAAGLAAAPAALGAPAPFTVQAGGFVPPQTDLDAFYPRNAVVREGDTLTFRFGGFHTVVFPARGGRVPAPAIPVGAPSPATNDPAGVPYWWTGLPQLQLNPAVFLPVGGRTVDGRRTVGSGVPTGDPSRFRFTVRFPKRGTYRVNCGLHSKMAGKVTVLPSSRRPPSGAVQKRLTARQMAADRRVIGRVLRQARASAGPSTVLIGPGRTRLTALAFVPANRTVAAGSELEFRMAGRNEIHTVTFGPSSFLDDLQGRSFEGRPGTAMASEAIYPSEPPGTTPDPTPTVHGNGFMNSGVLFDPGIPGPKRFTVRFSTPGQYDYRCLVHPFMRGRITVA